MFKLGVYWAHFRDPVVQRRELLSEFLCEGINTAGGAVSLFPNRHLFCQKDHRTTLDPNDAIIFLVFISTRIKPKSVHSRERERNPFVRRERVSNQVCLYSDKAVKTRNI